MNTSISIAMCVCEPKKKHLLAQLDSIANQTLLPNELIVCDDSKAPQEEFFRQVGQTTKINIVYEHNKKTLGIVNNFSSALQKTTGQYILLCDQDDIWESNKIQETVASIKQNEGDGNLPILFHSDLSLLSKSDKTLNSSFMEKQRIRGGEDNLLGVLVLHNVVTGCSAGMNRSLVEKALPIPETAVVHDWWLALVATHCGQIIFDKRKLIKYRLHDQNAIGLRPLFSFENIKRLMQFNHIGIEFSKVVKQNQAFQQKFKKELPSEINLFFDDLKVGGFVLINSAKKSGVKPQAFSRTIRFWIAALTKTYRKYL